MALIKFPHKHSPNITKLIDNIKLDQKKYTIKTSLRGKLQIHINQTTLYFEITSLINAYSISHDFTGLLGYLLPGIISIIRKNQIEKEERQLVNIINSQLH